MARKYVLSLFLLLLTFSACASPKSSQPVEGIADPTPTPTEMAGGIMELQKTEIRCSWLTGTLEVMLLVGPAEAVGMEPVAVGKIPISVISAEEPFLLEGASAINYEEVLEEKWGTYMVFFDMDATVFGECVGEVGDERLTVNVEMTGEQLVEVQSQGFQGEYPWSGTHQVALVLQLVDGAEASGEGWQFVLHLKQ